ncbi:hypothetical protein BCR39DRAFT_539096 [Naematelia encephala]|uniref:Uncharacterized protein n=1 Tax=Naematelia encephala TaxID=71784 RepID=A0A1Y2AWW9_9TREE|nr:hypothetical protein BCR39DRAFT_539096 [Naematelia encephala]
MPATLPLGSGEGIKLGNIWLDLLNRHIFLHHTTVITLTTDAISSTNRMNPEDHTHRSRNGGTYRNSGSRRREMDRGRIVPTEIRHTDLNPSSGMGTDRNGVAGSRFSMESLQISQPPRSSTTSPSMDRSGVNGRMSPTEAGSSTGRSHQAAVTGRHRSRSASPPRGSRSGSNGMPPPPSMISTGSQMSQGGEYDEGIRGYPRSSGHLFPSSSTWHTSGGARNPYGGTFAQLPPTESGVSTGGTMEEIHRQGFLASQAIAVVLQHQHTMGRPHSTGSAASQSFAGPSSPHRRRSSWTSPRSPWGSSTARNGTLSFSVSLSPSGEDPSDEDEDHPRRPDSLGQ